MCGMFEGPNDKQRTDKIPSFINDWMQNHNVNPETIGYQKRGWLNQSEEEMRAERTEKMMVDERGLWAQQNTHRVRLTVDRP